MVSSATVSQWGMHAELSPTGDSINRWTNGYFCLTVSPNDIFDYQIELRIGYNSLSAWGKGSADSTWRQLVVY